MARAAYYLLLTTYYLLLLLPLLLLLLTAEATRESMARPKVTKMEVRCIIITWLGGVGVGVRHRPMG